MKKIRKHILATEFYDDIASQSLVHYIESNIADFDKASLYYQFPIIRELNEKLLYPSILLISPNHGVIVFKCDGISKVREGYNLSLLDNEVRRIEDVIFSKLIKSTNKKMKRGKRDLSFNLSSALFMPNFTESIDPGDYESKILTNHFDINDFFDNCKEEPIEEEVLKEIYSIIDAATAIIKPKERKVKVEDKTSKSYVLKNLEEEIAVFDRQQKYAALSQLEGPQRIRGLAGSGKTIILCMKAAILHLKYPEKKILYTFMTKSLYDYIELLITRFYKVIGDGYLPDFEDSIHIRHAWGGANVEGVYYDCCIRNSVDPITFKQAAILAGRGEAFNYICNDLLKRKNGVLEKAYDYVLMDEAQDFKPSFYQICRAIVNNDCMVWGYDDLQNIFDVNIQDTISTFQNEFGAEGIDLGELQKKYPDIDNDIVLSKSYRNPKEILVTAHALGFGIYHEILIQSLQNNEHWHDLGYKVIQGNCKSGDHMIIERDEKNSPLSISKYQTAEEIIKLYSAKDFDDEVNWVCQSIDETIKVDGLRPDDIIVISLDDRYSKSYCSAISENLYSKGIFTHNLCVSSYEKGFTEDNCVTLSTVYKAKGNEAAMVIVVGCDILNSNLNNRSMRNKVFTAFTRAKAWLRVSGIDIENHSINKEINMVISKGFILDFIHKEAHTIQRDLAVVNQKKASIRKQYEEMVNNLKKKGFSDKEIREAIFDHNHELNGRDKV